MRGRKGRPFRVEPEEEPTDPIAARQGARLRLLHTEKEEEEGCEITYDDIGEAIGTTGGAFGHYERGRIRIPYEFLAPLSRYYGVSILYLLGLTDDISAIEDAPLSDRARLVCELTNKMSSPVQELVVTWTMGQYKLDQQEQAAKAG